MHAMDFAEGSNPEVRPSEYAGMMCTPLMTRAGSKNVNAYGLADSIKPIFGSRAWQSHIDIDRAPLQTIAPTESPFSARISPQHLYARMKKGRGIYPLCTHTRMVERQVQFQGTSL